MTMPRGVYPCCGAPFTDRHAPTCTAIKTRRGRARVHYAKVAAENEQDRKAARRKGARARRSA